MANQPALTLTALQTVKVNAQVNDDVNKGGQIELAINIKLAINSDAEEVDANHPLILELSAKADGKGGKEDDVVFTCSCTILATFGLEKGTIKNDKLNNYVDSMTPQVFIHARQVLSDLLMQMGVKSFLPLSMPVKLDEPSK